MPLTLLGKQPRYIDATTTFSLSEAAMGALVAIVVPFQPNWPKREVDLLGGDLVDGHASYAHLLIGADHDENEREWNIFANITVSQRELVGRIGAVRRRKLAEVLTAMEVLLASIKGTVPGSHFDVSVNWTFPPDSYVSIIHLPLLEFKLPGAPFDRISGVRVSNRPDSDEPAFSAILDLMPNSNLVASMEFAHHGPLGDDTFSAILAEADSRIAPLVHLQAPQGA